MRLGRPAALTGSIALHAALVTALVVTAHGSDLVGRGGGSVGALSVALVDASALVGTTAATEPASEAPDPAWAQSDPLLISDGDPSTVAALDVEASSAAADALSGPGRFALTPDALWPYVEPCWRALGGPAVGAGAVLRVSLDPNGAVVAAEAVDAPAESPSVGRAVVAGQRALRAVLACGPYPQLDRAAAAAPLTLRFAPG